ncbi:pleckstrin homology domain-containing family A member 8-like [Biomphalaria glabrata]|uniref:Pleckstrin homology domain-containing family A member 8-like n=1 Tax=Biomphalaria glabrata TaxID=6526 RepID=A0A2C9LZD1_BIOGL|nr:pleckstrin homology domain-containing family A member 8-like [Biomphalaria glabrata]
MSTNTEGIYMSDFSGNTIFGNLKQFSKLNEKKTINTELFIQACKDVTTLLDRLGAQFSIAKKDMLGNVKRIEERFNTNKSQYTTLNSIMEEDSKDSPKGHTSAIVGILWLKRGLEFLCAILDGLLKAYEKKVIDDNLRPIILEAYEKTLKPYHGMVSKFLFSNLTRLVPSKSNFNKALLLREDATNEMLFKDISLYLENFKDNLELINSLFVQYGLNLEESSK